VRGRKKTEAKELQILRAAGEVFGRQLGNNAWQLQAIERRAWPIYNWIDDYVVLLN